jgi:hypothetical protein
MKPAALQPEGGTSAGSFDNWVDPIESGIRERVREFIEGVIGEELDDVVVRPRYGPGTRVALREWWAIGTEAGPAH